MKFVSLGFLVLTLVVLLVSVLYTSSGSLAQVATQFTAQRAEPGEIIAAFSSRVTFREDLGEDAGIGCAFEDEEGNAGVVYVKDGRVRAMATASDRQQAPDRKVHLLVSGEEGRMWYDGERSGELFFLGEEFRETGGSPQPVSETATSSTSTGEISEEVFEGEVAQGAPAVQSLFVPNRLSRTLLREQLLSESFVCYTMAVADTLFEEPVLVEF
ncbi:MAG: hypothetical protein WDZ79_01900 [Candidatus Paceibacterota bacterium]